jgi:hypothetical protein
MKPKKTTVKRTGPITKPWPVFTRALEEGIRAGLVRSRKHTESPTDEEVFQKVYDSVLNEVLEVFDFPDECDS